MLKSAINACKLQYIKGTTNSDTFSAGIVLHLSKQVDVSKYYFKSAIWCLFHYVEAKSLLY